MEWVLLLVLLLVVGWLVLGRRAKRAFARRSAGTRTRTLEHRYRRLLHLPPKAADETLSRQLSALAAAHPGRSREWMLKKLISDLERARR